ncbi:MAG: hypothetical protein ACE5HB_07960 [Terriglobia bacterium]
MRVLPAHDIPITAEELKRRVAFWLHAERGPTNQPFSQPQARLLALLSSRLGQQNALRLEHLARRLENVEPGGTGHRVSDRTLKQLVMELRLDHHIKVGSLRGTKTNLRGLPARSPVAGYFLCLTVNDVLVTFGPRLHEALATLEVCTAMTDGRHGLEKLIAETRGQLRLFETTDEHG